MLRRVVLALVALFAIGVGVLRAEKPYEPIENVVTERVAMPIVKLNAAYALVGVVNPQVEFRLSPHSAFQTEFVYSPWQSINGHPMHFGIFLNEYRYYIAPQRTRGLYAGLNAGMMAFRMSKPQFVDGGISLQNRYCKGYGYMVGAVVGYEWQFARRWVLDIFVGFSYMHSNYNGYSMDGVVDMYPSRPDDKLPTSPDPFNSSAEWLPNKAGISIGFIL